MNIVHINSVFKFGSTGKILQQLYEISSKEGFTNYIFFGREKGANIESDNIKLIGNLLDSYLHVAGTRITDKHGLFSKKVTEKFINTLDKIKPDIVHLHNIHGYYINYRILFQYLKEKKIPIVWTLHDCWSFTGHCAYYEYVNCMKWKTQCFSCEQKASYPKSLFKDNSSENYTLKKESFTSIDNLYLVPVSKWLYNQLEDSFFKGTKKQVIENGIDLSIFKIDDKINKDKYKGKKIILGVSNIWEERKGLSIFLDLSKIIKDNCQIILVGLSEKQIKLLPPNIIGISRTQNIEELVYFYNLADVFVNPTFEDNFPTTNIEALACGTPVITFPTGGSVEIVSETTGIVTKNKTVSSIIDSLDKIFSKSKYFFSKECRARAEELYNKDKNFLKYIDLYNKILKHNEN